MKQVGNVGAPSTGKTRVADGLLAADLKLEILGQASVEAHVVSSCSTHVSAGAMFACESEKAPKRRVLHRAERGEGSGATLRASPEGQNRMELQRARWGESVYTRSTSGAPALSSRVWLRTAHGGADPSLRADSSLLAACLAVSSRSSRASASSTRAVSPGIEGEKRSPSRRRSPRLWSTVRSLLRVPRWVAGSPRTARNSADVQGPWLRRTSKMTIRRSQERARRRSSIVSPRYRFQNGNALRSRGIVRHKANPGSRAASVYHPRSAQPASFPAPGPAQGPARR